MSRRSKIFNLPNLITGGRFLLSGCLMLLLLLEQTPDTALVAFWVFAIAGVLYLLINLVLITLVRLLEARLTRYLPR